MPKTLGLIAVGLAATVVLVGIGFWHRRQLDADLEGHEEHRTDRWGPSVDARPFTVRGERAEQEAFRGEGSYSYGEFAGGDVPDEE
jgi:hypothetical protein